MTPEIKNAVIASVSLTKEDHGMLVANLTLDYGGSGQGFGNRCLYNPNFPTDDWAGFYLWRVMETVGVDSWEKLQGRPVRVLAHHGLVSAIGHYIEDKWFNPEEEFDTRHD